MQASLRRPEERRRGCAAALVLGGGGEVEEDILVLDLGSTGSDMDLGTKEGRGNEIGDEGGAERTLGKFGSPA